MTMTEDEAKTKWCPFARYDSGDGAPSNRWKQSLPASEPDALNPVACRCIGSACMAWRWQPAGSMDRPTRTGPGNASVARTRGYCGLAGSP
jgi:hypothetical protein